MSRARTGAISLAVGAAAAIGVLAGVTLNARQPASIDRQVAQRRLQLDRYEASLRKTLAQRLPQLPALVSTGAPQSIAAPRIVYRRPAPHVVRAPRAAGEHEYEGNESDD